MGWILFFSGLFLGGILGVFAICLCVAAGEESRREERRRSQNDQADSRM